MEMKTRVPTKPGFHPRMFVCSIIVYYEMQIETLRGFVIYLLEKANKLLVSEGEQRAKIVPKSSASASSATLAFIDINGFFACSAICYFEGAANLEQRKTRTYKKGKPKVQVFSIEVDGNSVLRSLSMAIFLAILYIHVDTIASPRKVSGAWLNL